MCAIVNRISAARAATGIARAAANSSPVLPGFDPRKETTMQSGDAGTSYSGWAAFAGVIMVVVGSLDALWGLGGILNDDVVVVGGHGAILADITTWGWVHLILGTAIALTGVGLLVGNEAARWFGVLFVAVNAVLQIVWFPAAPLWAFLLILLDVTIIYQLTARWNVQARWD
jgi:hypothetical protein